MRAESSEHKQQERFRQESISEKHANRLIHEKSPYLLQHAYNPVHWYPWGNEAFEKAKKEDKPVFLSIGYSTCHWCHVMEHESFEDPEVARLMNDTFVSVKVDREERPDLDSLYMDVCQMFTGRGGWPLNIVMSPDKRPFYAATYIPKETRFGIIGMLELVPILKNSWLVQRGKLMESADQCIVLLNNQITVKTDKEPDTGLRDSAYKEFERHFDSINGGFGSAPKFPSAHSLFFLLRYYKRTGNLKALHMVEKTLQSMKQGGIYDHIGFGFHRYATDARWIVPHFEKMLYDQAMLAMAYTEAYQATCKDEYKKTAKDILTYVLRDMISPEGGFYSAEDADSEGTEGKFYLWTPKEIEDVLGAADSDFIKKVFNIEESGNFFDQATGEKIRMNIPYPGRPFAEIASGMRITEHDLLQRVEQLRQKLLAAREGRIRPQKDDKILADWNGLIIASLAKAAEAFDEKIYADIATKAMDFILKEMRNSDGRLFHRYRDGETAIPAYLNDYVFLIWGLLELYEATFDARHLKTALELNAGMVSHFVDNESGGFYLTPDDGEPLPARQKEVHDSAIPSGNAVAMLNLLRIARITEDTAFEDMASKTARAFSAEIAMFPSACAQFLCAIDFTLGPSYSECRKDQPTI